MVHVTNQKEAEVRITIPPSFQEQSKEDLQLSDVLR